jgi:hypothetical protein
MFSRWPAFVAFAVAFSVLHPVTAQDFRVATEVLVDHEEDPTSESLTLFTGDVVYDFLLAPNEETTVFDIRRGKIQLLDPRREIKTSLTTEQLAEFSAAIKSRGSAQGPTHLFQPAFQFSFDDEQKRLTLSSDRLTYAVKGIPAKHPSGAQRYRQFADWYARLNAIRPGNLPPFSRLELNEALADRNLLPLEVERSLVVDRPVGNKTLHAKSKHTITWLISGTDQGRIDQTAHDLAKFREVLPSEFWMESLKTARNK